MKQLALILFLMCVGHSIIASAATTFIDGYELQTKWKEAQKISEGREGNYPDASLYQGYVIGVADSLNGIMFDIPLGVKRAQVMAIVGKYLDDNPDEWNTAADSIVRNALEKAFPRSVPSPNPVKPDAE